MNVSFVSLVSITALTVSQAFGNGTRLPSQDGEAVARGYAVVAGSHSSSSLYYNPAGLAEVRDNEVLAGVYTMLPSVEYTSSATGRTVKEQSDVFYQPHAFAATSLGDRITLGVGFYSPFGQSTDWPTSSGFAGAATFNEIKYLTAAVGAAVKLSDQLSFGMAVQYNKVHVDLNRLTAISPTAVTEFGFKGSDDALSASVGLQWSLSEHHRVGIQYQRKTDFRFDGTASLAGVLTQPGSLPWVFPDNLAIGWQIVLSPTWDVEVSYDRTFWGRVNTLQLDAGPLSTAIPLNWQDSAYYGIGFTHTLSRMWSFSAGYNYSESSVSDQTFSPSLPDVDRHLVAAGIFYSTRAWELQFVLQRGFEGSRTVVGPAPDGIGGTFAGTFRNSLWAANIGATLRF